MHSSPPTARPPCGLTSKAWKPAHFDHALLAKADLDRCESCHKNNDYGRYACYGCQGHSLARVRQKHVEEGIRNFENCVACHRDPRGEPGQHGGRE